MNLALWITWLRILAIPIIVLVYFLPINQAHAIAALAFALVAVTDWLDGFLARHLGQATRLGAFLDPVADKLLVSIALITVLSQHDLPFLALPAAVIVGREIAVSALREWMAEIGKRTSVAVTFIAKVKTCMQMVAIGVLLFYKPHMSVYVLCVGILLLYAAAILTLWSMLVYIKIAWPDLTLNHKSQ